MQLNHSLQNEIKDPEKLEEEEDCPHNNVKTCIVEIWRRYYEKDEEVCDYSVSILNKASYKDIIFA